MSDELSTSFFSITGRTGRVAYFFQNSILMIFGFQYIYGGYMSSAFLSLQHNPLFSNAFEILKTNPLYADFLRELNHPAEPDPSALYIKFAFIIALRIVDLKRVRDILSRKLSAIETILIAIFFSLPFVDFFSTIMLVTLPSKKHSKENAPLKEAHAIDVKEAQRERLLKQNEAMFKAGKISRADFERAREKYSK